MLFHLLQVCTRCLIKQKEEELSTQKALSAIEEARTGRGMLNSREGEFHIKVMGVIVVPFRG